LQTRAKRKVKCSKLQIVENIMTALRVKKRKLY